MWWKLVFRLDYKVVGGEITTVKQYQQMQNGPRAQWAFTYLMVVSLQEHCCSPSLSLESSIIKRT